MKQEEPDGRRCSAQPMRTVLHEFCSAEVPPSADTGPSAGSRPVAAPLQAIPLATDAARRLGRVLVVDDDKVIRQLIAANLTLEGFDVATAVDGQDCLNKVSVLAPDVITLDLMMPRLDGCETAIRLRENPETSHIKIVLITAGAWEGDRKQDRPTCADAHLAKPFDPAEMIRVIRELAGVPPVPFS